MKLNTTWFLFYGRQLHMSRHEIMATRYGEMIDMISCLAISEGRVRYKAPARKYSFDEAIALQ